VSGGIFDWQIDGTDCTYGERLSHYQEMLGRSEAPSQVNDAAHQLATEEILTEIHAMLRFLCKEHERTKP
jgi:hypothetical protein